MYIYIYRLLKTFLKYAWRMRPNHPKSVRFLLGQLPHLTCAPLHRKFEQIYAINGNKNSWCDLQVCGM